MSGRALIYGATGYTGREVAGRLKGLEPVLAGRDPVGVRALAERLGLEWRAFPLTDASEIQSALADIDVVLHAAGPFVETAGPMLDACLATRTHYLDLAGEWPVFIDAMARDAAARAVGVMVTPGVGLTIAASDCLLAQAVERWPDTVRLMLGVSRAQVFTKGSIASATRLLNSGVLVRRKGELTTEPAGSLAYAFDFGAGQTEAAAINWPDVVTGEFTTGVGNIETYSEFGWPLRAGYRAMAMAIDVTGPGPWRKAGEALAAAWPEGPSPEARRDARYVMVVEALDRWRRPRRLTMVTLDGYTVSELTAAAAVERVLAGDWRPGFQTPARAFGSEFVFELGAASLTPSFQSATEAAL